MGEIADAIMDGTFCQICGDFMGESRGFAATCSGCGGDDEDSYSDQKALHKAKVANNREWSSNFLKSNGITFESKNNGAHLIVTDNGTTWDFWPGTGKYAQRSKHPRYRRGVKELLRDIQKNREVTA